MPQNPPPEPPLPPMPFLDNPPPKPPYVIPDILERYWDEMSPNFVGPTKLWNERDDAWIRSYKDAMREWQNQGGDFA